MMTISELVSGVDLLVKGEHLLAKIDAEVVDSNVLALEEGREELPGEAVRVFLVETAEFGPLSARRQVLLALPLEHSVCEK